MGLTRYKLALVLAGALGLWLGFPNALSHIPLCALIYPAALCLLGLTAASRAEALRLGWLTGLIGASVALHWLALPVQQVGGLPPWLAAPCAMAIGAYVGLYGGFFALGAYILRRVPPLPLALGLGVLWYLLEIARGTLLTGFPWLTLAAAFVPWPFMVQGASLIGAYALGGVFAGIACLIALGSRAKAASYVAAILLIVLAGGGMYRLHTVPPLRAQSGQPVSPPEGAVPLILVEGNIDQNQKWEPALQQQTVDTYTTLTRTALAAQRALQPSTQVAPLVIWPETAMPFYLTTHPVFGLALRRFVVEEDITVIAGAPGIERPTEKTFEIFNRAYMLEASGRVRSWYDKAHLVPFGEYLPPWLAFDFLKPLLQGVGDFTPGRSTGPLSYESLALGMLICYEAVFPELAYERVRDGANVLLNISNDGWFGDSSAPEQHLQLSVLRAVEQERWLIRGTNTGISAIIDPYGHVPLRGGQFHAQALHGYCWTNTSKSVYFVLRDFLPWLAAGLLCVTGIMALRQRQQK